MMEMTLKYQDALNRLEDCLVTPVMPGELSSWLGTLAEAAETTGALLWRQIEGPNQQEYAQIEALDPNLCPHVEMLKKGDQDSYQRLEAFMDQIARVRRRAEMFSANEILFQTPVNSLLDEGLSWVIHAKRQEKARESWYLEAFIRDRGEGD